MEHRHPCDRKRNFEWARQKPPRARADFLECIPGACASGSTAAADSAALHSTKVEHGMIALVGVRGYGTYVDAFGQLDIARVGVAP